MRATIQTRQNEARFLLCLSTLLAICAAMILLSSVMPAWLAATIVGLIVGAVAWIISKAITTLRNTDLKPQETVESLKEDAQWIKDQIS
jgi:uncharacterized membrane-anchored protein